MRWLLAACYPLLAHLALTQERIGLEWVALNVLFAVFYYAELRRRRAAIWLAYAGFAALSAALMALDPRTYALFVPPLVFPALMLGTFAGSLRPGQVPLVTRIATDAHGGRLEPELLSYTRTVTWIWTLLLVGILATDATLLVCASRAIWSLWSNFLGYLLIGAVFAGEYLYRRVRFRALSQPGFAEHLRLLARVRPHAG